MTLTVGYEELVRQNWGFLPSEDQQAIGRTRVLLAGCGLGSNIAVLAARTGFNDFIIADGDLVEGSNLNRQAFRVEHLGRNKAEATEALIKEINPHAQVQAITRFIEADDAASLVDGVDVVVNMVDPGPALYSLLGEARSRGKITLFPMNVGFGGVVFAFGSDSPTFEQLVGSQEGGNLFVDIVLKLMPSLPSYLWQYGSVAQRIQREGVAPPQLGVASSVTTSIVVGAMVKVAKGSDIPIVPAFMALDSREPSERLWPANFSQD